MKNSTTFKKRYKTFTLIYWAILATTVAVALLPHWPESPLMSLGSYILLFVPRWWMLVLPILLLVFYKHLKRWQRFSIFPIALVCIEFTDIQWIPYYSANTPEQFQIRIMSANTGNTSEKTQLLKTIKDHQPHIVFLQEAGKPVIEQLFDTSWITDCADSLCIASKFVLQRVGNLDRSSRGGWGNYAAKYEADIYGQRVELLNVHLDSPRSVLEGLIHMDIDFPALIYSVRTRNIQAKLIRNWLTKDHSSIIAGDFNMPVNENIYRHYLSNLGNALDYSSIGLRYTKYTNWHGLRIDHILFDNSFVVKEAKVLEDAGGDHRPILTVLGKTL